MALVLGVDSSTQSTKVEVRDLETGKVISTGSARHPVTTPPSSEQEPEAWWIALVDACAQLGDVRSEVVAMSVTGQQHGFVVLDAKGESIRPAKLWNDTTSAPQAADLVQALGVQAWTAATGSVPVASFTVTKLAWLAENEPESLAVVARIMLPHDYLTWRLCGQHVTDRGDASGTGWYSPRHDSYQPQLITAAVADGRSEQDWLALLPTVLGPGEAAGTLTSEAAAALGLASGVVVGPGTGDNMAAALGLGLGPGDIAMSLGTSGTVYAVSATPTEDQSGAVAGFADANGGFLPLVATLNATKVTDAVARWLGTDAPGLADLAMRVPQSDGGPVLIPYFDGERTPNLPDATGTILGLTTSTTREQLALAAHDGVLCGLLDGLDTLIAAGASASGRVNLIGGGSRSVAYRQRLADLMGSPVMVPSTNETVATGAAVQAAMVLDQASAAELAKEWKLGSGTIVDPMADASAVRSAYLTANESGSQRYCS